MRFVYNNARSSLVKYAGENLLFTDIDYKFLMAYENHLRQFGAEDGGVSTYMRTIRAVINEAIRRGVIESNRYPFSTQFNKNGYSISKLKVKWIPGLFQQMTWKKAKSLPWPGKIITWCLCLCIIPMDWILLIWLGWPDPISRVTLWGIPGRKLKSIHPSTPWGSQRIIEHFNGQTTSSRYSLISIRLNNKAAPDHEERQHFNTFMRKLGKSLGIETQLHPM